MTEEYKNKTGTDNHVGVADDIGLVMLNEQKANLEKQIKMHEENIENAQKSYDNYKEQWDIDKRLFELESENFGMVPEKVTHKVQLMPEYWELQKKKHGFQVRFQTHQAEGQLDAYMKEKEAYEKQLAINKENLAKILSKIEEAE